MFSDHSRERKHGVKWMHKYDVLHPMSQVKFSRTCSGIIWDTYMFFILEVLLKQNHDDAVSLVSTK
jgi:hypothetical protein